MKDHVSTEQVEVQCPALLLAAPASGQGKTTVTAALARLHRNAGRVVRVFKTGPDFLDPMILERASGQPVYQLDTWMMGEEHCRGLLHAAARHADLIIIEGVMGLYDGTPSTADLSQRLGVPIAVLINGSAMAQTFAAIAHGLATFRSGLRFTGVLANQVAGAAHAEMLRSALPDSIVWLGALYRNDALSLPSRHLGLVQAQELDDLDARLESGAESIAGTQLASLPAAVPFRSVTEPAPAQLLRGSRIAVARDVAFAFLYRANLDLLEAMGANLLFFSPLTDLAIPEADSLYLPGGYPELHLRGLAANESMLESLRAFHDQGKQIYAECGGMLYLLDSLTHKDGSVGELVGLIPGHAVMLERLSALGFQSVHLPGGELRGHTFHHSRMETTLEPVFRGSPQKGDGPGEPVYRVESLTASYLHLYFPSAPEAAAKLFGA